MNRLLAALSARIRRPAGPGRARDLAAAARDAERRMAAGFRAFGEYEQTGRPEALAAALAAFPPGHPELPGYLSNLGNVLIMRFLEAGDTAEMDAAVDAEQRAVDLAPPDHPDLAKMRSNLGVALRIRFERAGDVADLDAAIDAGRRAVDRAPPGHPELAMYLWNLEVALLARFERAGDAADLDAAVDAGRRAVDLAPPGHPGLAGYLSSLGNALLRRFERAGDAADLDAAIDAGRRAVEITPPGHPGLALYLSNHGIALRTRSERTGDGADLDAAIDAGRRAVEITPPGHPDLAMYLANLGVTLLFRFERAGDGADLDAAIDAGRRAVEITPPAHRHLAAMLSGLGGALRTRFERGGDAADLDAAVDAGRRAVDLAPPGSHHFAGHLTNLQSALLARFERAGDGADLDAAIDAGRRAVEITPPGHPRLAMMLSNLAGALRARFERAGDGADLDAAIDAGRRAVEITPPGHSGLALYLSNHGLALLARFEWAGDAADLDAAVDAGRRAVEITPAGRPGLAGYLSNLEIALLVRFERAGDGADLDAAIDAGRRAVEITPPGHPDLAGYLLNLGNTLLVRFERAGNGADLDAAISSWQQGSQVPAGAPNVRLGAAEALGAAAADAGRMHEAAEGYAAAVGLLPVVAFHGLGRAAREEHLARWAGLAADAAACAVLDGRPEAAVELLEQGRSVLWTQALNLRTDLTRLVSHAPELAERLTSIRQVLDTPMPAADPLVSASADGTALAADGARRQQEEAADLRRRKAREWDDVVAQVRALDGFGHFLAAVPYPELAAAAAGGPAVIVNASRHGCHALIIDAGSEHARVVSLPALSLDAAVRHADTMLAALAGAAVPGRGLPDRERDRHAILDVLDWLWDAIAQPVLTALGHTAAPDPGGPWPRVWWCPTGPLTVLPLHAAGHHPRLRTAAARSADSVPDRVISSCTPTLTALIRARQPAAGTGVRQLTVGMPATPGQSPLPAVPAELKVLARHFPPGNGSRQLAGPQATRAAVLTAIADHSWVHLACHASQQHADPARSGFNLWDGTLTITDLAAQPTQGRDLAFLSACQTAAGSVRHLDEAIHLAAAMQFLGYRHVIATLWTINDSPAPHLADTVYTTLTQDGKPDPGSAAEALHYAIHTLRQTDPTNPLLWAPYIHLGT